MKRLISLLLFFFLPFSCKKDDISSTFRKKVTGVWELEHFYGIAGIPYPPGNGRIIALFDNGVFERRQHDTVLFKGKYFLNVKSDCYPRKDNIFFTTNENPYSWDSYINVNDSGKLVLSSSNCLADGGTSIYRKL